MSSSELEFFKVGYYTYHSINLANILLLILKTIKLLQSLSTAIWNCKITLFTLSIIAYEYDFTIIN